VCSGWRSENGFKRQLRGDATIFTATSGLTALQLLSEEQVSIAVLVSDLQMPGMNGIELLAEAARIAPDTVRVMLTGESDQRAAIAAVNEGAVFRFLTKPCDSETLRATIRAGIEQHRLVTAEKELLGKTVGGQSAYSQIYWHW
jgi:DNA-binding NtrC family response regulator